MKIVQLGANRGNDHVTELVKSNDISFLLLVEPHPVAVELLKNCYKDVSVIIEQCAIVETEMDFVSLFYADDPNPNYEVSSLYKSHLEKHGTSPDKIIEIEVPAMTLEKLFTKYNIKDLDYFFMDIEGSEEQIILGFDFNKYNIQHIVAEHVHMKNQNDVNNYLHTFGYTEIIHQGFETKYSKVRG